MSGLRHSVDKAFSSVTESAKVKDLNHDRVNLERGSCLTTDFGVKVADTDNWYLLVRPSLRYSDHFRLKATDGSTSGPSLLEDQVAGEKTHRFDHERIPERVVHARGAGAHGYFRVFNDNARKYTKASVLTEPSRKTPVFVRFSNVQGSRGSAVRLLPVYHTAFLTL